MKRVLTLILAMAVVFTLFSGVSLFAADGDIELELVAVPDTEAPGIVTNGDGSITQPKTFDGILARGMYPKLSAGKYYVKSIMKVDNITPGAGNSDNWRLGYWKFEQPDRANRFGDPAIHSLSIWTSDVTELTIDAVNQSGNTDEFTIHSLANGPNGQMTVQKNIVISKDPTPLVIPDELVAQNATALISAIPADPTTNMSAVATAKKAYDYMTDAQKALLDDAVVEKLNTAYDGFGFVTVSRPFTISSDNLKNQTSKLNPRLWWQFKGKAEVPFAFGVANLRLIDSTGKVVEEFNANYNDTLQFGSSAPPAGKFSEIGFLLVDSGWTLGDDNQTQVWSNGFMHFATGDYTFEIDVKIDKLNQIVLDQLDTNNLVKFNIWNGDLNNQMFPTDGEGMGVSLRELQIGTEAYIDEVAVQAVTELISAIPATITEADAAAVNDAKVAYDALTDAQKALVAKADVDKLNAAVATVGTFLSPQKVIDNIAALPAEIKLADAAAVNTAKGLYDSLSAEQKALVPAADLEKLTTAVDTIAALQTSELIKGIPQSAIEAYAGKVNAAKAAYDALSDDAKALVPEAEVEKLNAAIEAVAAAQGVIDIIAALPEEVTEADADAVNAAVEAYNALSDEAKALISASDLEKLSIANFVINPPVTEEPKDTDDPKETEDSKKTEDPKDNENPKTVDASFAVTLLCAAAATLGGFKLKKK